MKTCNNKLSRAKTLVKLFAFVIITFFTSSGIFAQSNSEILISVDGSAVSATLEAQANDWYKFMPSSTGVHIIETHGGTDTYMTLYQNDKTTVISEDDDGGENSCSLISSNLIANTWYYIAVRGYNEETIGNYNIDIISSGSVSSTLGPPRNLTGSLNNLNATLSWYEPAHGLPTSYNVYRSYSENGDYTLMNTYTNRYATITGLSASTSYWFYVTSVYYAGESLPSNKINLTTGSSTQNITTISVDAQAITAVLSAGDNDWFKFLTGSQGTYVIETHGTLDTKMALYSSNQTSILEEDDDGGSNNCSKISHTLLANTWYYIKVRGYNSNTTGNYTIDIKGPATLIHNAPQNLTATAGNESISLNWSIPNISTPSNYRVYQSLSENSSYSLVKTTNTLSTTITGLTNSTTYWFYVIAMYDDEESPISNKVNATPGTNSETAQTLVIDAAAVNGYFDLNEVDWYKFRTTSGGTHTIETHGNTDTYMVLYEDDQTSIIVTDDDGGANNCAKISQNLESNKWYYVKVKGFNPTVAGNYTIDVTGPETVAPKPPRFFTGSSRQNGATFSWTEPELGTPTGYIIYQSLNENGVYSAINGTITGKTTTISGLSNGTTYWFYSKAVYGMQESSPSNKISITPGTTTQGIIDLTVDANALAASLTANDNDWYKFYTATSGTYTIETHGSVDTYMNLYSSDQTTNLAYDDDSGSSGCSKIEIHLNANSWYFIKIRGYSTSTTGSYTIDIKSPEANALFPPRNLTASAGNASVTFSWSEPVSGIPTWYKLYKSNSENGSYQLVGTYTSRNITISDLSNGTTYWFYATAVYSEGESISSNKVYTIPNATSQDVTTLSINAPATNASLISNSNNWFKFYASTSGEYTIETHGNIDTYMILYQNDRNSIIQENDDGGSNNCSKITSTLSANTWYYIMIRGYNATTSGNYTIDVLGSSNVLSPPLNLTPTANDGGATLNWSSPASGTPTSYKIYKSNSVNGTFTLLGTFNNLTASLSNLTNGTTYWFYVTAVYSTGESSSSNIVSVTPTATTQEISTLIIDGPEIYASLAMNDNDWYKFYTTNTGMHSIETHGTTDTYLVLYRSDKTSIIQENDDGGNGSCSKISSYLNANTWYYVMVRGYNTTIAGNYSVDITGPNSTTNNAPYNLIGTNGDGSATLNWSAPTSGNPTQYKVYRSLTENGTYTPVTTTTNIYASFSSLTNGTTYWFYVTAVYTTGESAASNKINVRPSTTSQTTAILTVDGSALSALLTANENHWYKFHTSSTGTHTIETHGNTDTYMTLYQSDKVSVIENDDDSGSGYCSRISSNLTANTWYYIKIRGYRSSTAGNYSIDVEGPVTTALAPPRNIIASAGNGEVRLNWDSPFSGSPTSYRIYWSYSENGSYTALSTTYTDKTALVTGLSNSTTYWFYVTAIYGAGESSSSNKLSVIPGITGTNEPRNLTVSTGNGEATFNWQAPYSSTPTGYKLYWCPTENGTYTSLERIYTGTTASIAILSNGSTYWFYVKAIYSSSESAPSNRVSVTLPATQTANQNKSSYLIPIIQIDDLNRTVDTEIKLYPNPFNDLIRIGNEFENITISIFDINGRLMFSDKGKFDEINTSKLKSGYYFVNIQIDSNKPQMVKMIKR